MKKRILSILVLCVLIFCSCKKNKYNYYDGMGILQFGPTLKYLYDSYYAMTDTVKTYSFAYQNSETVVDTVYFDIYALGGIKDYDRPFVLKQVSVSGKPNAIPGVHYRPFDSPQLSDLYVMKSGTFHMRVPVVLLRDASLKNESYTLQFEVGQNEFFIQGEEAKIWRRVEFADMLIQPNSWNANMSTLYWGAYSRVKHAFMIDSTGEPWDEEFMAIFPYDQLYGVYWKTKLRTFLAEYNNAHPGNPLRDENGALVVFPN